MNLSHLNWDTQFGFLYCFSKTLMPKHKFYAFPGSPEVENNWRVKRTKNNTFNAHKQGQTWIICLRSRKYLPRPRYFHNHNHKHNQSPYKLLRQNNGQHFPSVCMDPSALNFDVLVSNSTFHALSTPICMCFEHVSASQNKSVYFFVLLLSLSQTEKRLQFASELLCAVGDSCVLSKWLRARLHGEFQPVLKFRPTDRAELTQFSGTQICRWRQYSRNVGYLLLQPLKLHFSIYLRFKLEN